MFVEAIKGWKGQAPPAAPASTREAASQESRAMAERYEELATRIDALGLSSEELLPRAARYQKLAREAAGALRDVALAVQRGDAEGARRRRVEFDEIAKGEAPLVEDINAVCR